MVTIGIVDDEYAIRNLIEKCIIKALGGGQKTVRICQFEDSETFLEAVSQGEQFDILLADIQMKGMDGMELGRQVRKLRPEMYIIYITSYEEYAAESYRIEAWQYILKQDIDSRLPGVIRELTARIENSENKFRVLTNGAEHIKMFYRDIIYLYKSKGTKYVNYVTKQGIYRERNSLNTVIRELSDERFLPVERGYVVNMEHILKIRKDTLCLDKGYEVQVSHARLHTVKEQISRCWSLRG